MFNKKDKIKNLIEKIKNIKSSYFYISLAVTIILSFIVKGFLEIKLIFIFLLLAISLLRFFKKKEGFVKDIILIVFFAIAFRSFIFEPFHIPSGSMKPNLLIHDYIVVSKISYGYSRFSLPFGLDLFSGRIFADKPERGDVAVFRNPKETNINYIKRIIGLPGDKIKLNNGQVFINNIAVPKEYDKEFKDLFKNGNQFIVKQFNETLPNNRIVKIIDYGNSIADNTDEYIVPKNHYFAMGDNRDNSNDSRFISSVGFIPYENLIGEAKIIFFSARYPFLQFLKWPFNIRFDRIFKLIK
ncbi:signal peptidase I [Rickettsiales bacterium]|nr:signal peptidase I [Rickettsiales bacterium]